MIWHMAAVALAIALPVWFCLYRTYVSDIRVLSFELLQKNRQIANIVANQINETVQNTFRVLEATARYPRVSSGDLSGMEPLLKTLIQKYKIFNALYLISERGELLLNVTQVPDVFSSKPSADFFANIIRGKVANYLSRDVYISRASMRPAVTMGVVIRGELYSLEAVLAAEMDMGVLLSTVRGYDVGSRGEVFVADENGRIVTHPKYDNSAGTGVFDFLPQEITERIGNPAETGRTGQNLEGGFLYTDRDTGGRYFAAFVKMRKYNEFMEQMPEWTVVVRQPADEFLAATGWLWNKRLELMLICLLFGSGAGYLLWLRRGARLT
jgi:hypothetical protein